MSEVAEIIEGYIEKFDALREVYLDENTRCFLLVKTEFQANQFRILKELAGGFYLYFSTYFNSFILQYATLDASFKDVSKQAAFIYYGGVIYEIPEDNRVVIKPNGKKPFYQFFCSEPRYAMSFTPPV